MPKLSNRDRSSKSNPRKKQLKLPGVRIYSPEGRHWISSNSTAHADSVAHLLASGDSTDVTVMLCHLERWPREFRFCALRAIHLAGVPIATSKQTLPAKRSVFEAVLDFVQPDQNVDEETAISEAICEAIALLEPAQHEAAINQARRKLKELGVKPPRVSWFREAIKNLTAADDAPGIEPQTIAKQYLASLRDNEDVSDDEDVPWLRRRNGAWHLYSGQIYRTVTDEFVESGVVNMLQSYGCQLKITRPLVRDVLLNLQALCALDDLPMHESIFIDAESGIGVSSYVACQNGLLDLRPILDGESDLPELSGFSPRHFSTVELGFEFDQEATCPEYEKFIQEVLPAREVGDRRVERLEQFAAWALSNSALRLEKAAVLVGNGANGKSTFLNMLTELLGAGTVSHVALQDFGHRFRPAQMSGKLANISNDMSRVERFEEGLFKQLVSGDPIQFEEKNKPPVTCYCHAKLIFATNHLPAINDRTAGTFRRLLVIPFKESFSEAKADKHLDAKLAQELPGIANRLFRALASLVRDGGFAECRVCAKTEARYRTDNDPFLQFFAEHCELNKLATTKCSELYRHYSIYCRDNGRHPVHSAEFARRVEQQTGMSMKRPGSKGPRQRVLPGVRYVDHVQRE